MGAAYCILHNIILVKSHCHGVLLPKSQGHRQFSILMQPGAVYGQSQIVTLVAALSTVTVHLGVTTPCNEGGLPFN